MSTTTLTLRPAGHAMADLALLAQVAQGVLEFVQLARDLGDGGTQLVRIDLDGAAAAAAGECRVALELSDGAAELVAALRAGKFGFVPVEVDHGKGASDGC